MEGTPKPACYVSEPMYIRTQKGEIVYRGVYFRKAKKHCIDIIGEPVSFYGTSRADVEDKVSMWVESGIDVDCASRKHQHLTERIHDIVLPDEPIDVTHTRCFYRERNDAWVVTKHFRTKGVRSTVYMGIYPEREAAEKASIEMCLIINNEIRRRNEYDRHTEKV